MDTRKSRRTRFNTENKWKVEHACFTALKQCTWKYFKTFSANENVELYQKTENTENGVQDNYELQHVSKYAPTTFKRPTETEKAAPGT